MLWSVPKAAPVERRRDGVAVLLDVSSGDTTAPSSRNQPINRPVTKHTTDTTMATMTNTRFPVVAILAAGQTSGDTEQAIKVHLHETSCTTFD